MHSQIESGSTCPTTMTKACIPLMRLNGPLYAAVRGAAGFPGA
jgi:putative acyl-CoA dehydrogenase